MENKNATQNKFVKFITQSFGAVGKYVLGKLIAMVIIIIVAGFSLKALDAQLANDSIKGEFLIGVLMGVGNLVPIVGVWVGIALSAIIVLAQTVPDAWYMFLFVIGIGLLLQIIDEFIITPLVVGRAIDLKPLVIIAVVYLGGFLIQPPVLGMAIAVPVAAVVKIAYNIFFKKSEQLPAEAADAEKAREKSDGSKV